MGGDDLGQGTQQSRLIDLERSHATEPRGDDVKRVWEAIARGTLVWKGTDAMTYPESPDHVEAYSLPFASVSEVNAKAYPMPHLPDIQAVQRVVESAFAEYGVRVTDAIYVLSEEESIAKSGLTQWVLSDFLAIALPYILETVLTHYWATDGIARTLVFDYRGILYWRRHEVALA